MSALNERLQSLRWWIKMLAARPQVQEGFVDDVTLSWGPFSLTLDRFRDIHNKRHLNWNFEVGRQCTYHDRETGERCQSIGEGCWYDAYEDGPQDWVCYEHLKASGFCPGCHLFWAGVESFDFGPGWCDNCASEFEQDDWEDDDMDWDFPSYHGPGEWEEEWDE